jgi:hypothetical protein
LDFSLEASEGQGVVLDPERKAEKALMIRQPLRDCPILERFVTFKAEVIWSVPGGMLLDNEPPDAMLRHQHRD